MPVLTRCSYPCQWALERLEDSNVAGPEKDIELGGGTERINAMRLFKRDIAAAPDSYLTLPSYTTFHGTPSPLSQIYFPSVI